MARSTLSFLVCALALAVRGAPAGAAPSSGVANVGLLAQPDPCAPDGAVTLLGVGFLSGEPVVVYFDGVPWIAQNADPDGSFAADATVPASAYPGTHALLAVGQVSLRRTTILFTVSTPWLQSGFDRGGSHHNRHENILDTAGTGRLMVSQSWRLQAPLGQPPLALGSRLVITDGTSVSVLDRRTGRIVWKVDLRAPITGTPAILRPRTVVVPTGDGLLRALDLRSGRRLWENPAGRVLFDIFVVHPATLKGFNPQPDPPCHLAAVNEAGHLLVISSMGETERRLPLNNLPVVPPVGYGGPDSYGGPDTFGGRREKVLIGSDGGIEQYLCDGSVREWRYPLPNAPTTLMVVPYGILFTTEDGFLTALDFAGRMQWNLFLGAATGLAEGADGSATELDVLACLQGGELARITMGRSGPEVMTVPLRASPRGAPVVAGPVAWVTLANQEAWAFDARTGAALYALQAPWSPLSPATVVDGQVWMGTALGELLLLE